MSSWCSGNLLLTRSWMPWTKPHVGRYTSMSRTRWKCNIYYFIILMSDTDYINIFEHKKCVSFGIAVIARDLCLNIRKILLCAFSTPPPPLSTSCSWKYCICVTINCVPWNLFIHMVIYLANSLVNDSPLNVSLVNSSDSDSNCSLLPCLPFYWSKKPWLDVQGIIRQNFILQLGI